MTISSYLIAWLIYAVSSLGLCMILFQFLKTYFVNLKIRQLSPLFVLLLTPYFTNTENVYLAPAMLVALFEFMFGAQDQAIKAIIPVLILLTLILGMSIKYKFKKST